MSEYNKGKNDSQIICSYGKNSIQNWGPSNKNHKKENKEENIKFWRN